MRYWFLEGEMDEVNGTTAVPITQSPFIIGRGDDAPYKFEFRDVSKHHAELETRGNSLIIRDLGSKNGTYVNDTLLAGPRPLGDGDVIRVAGHDIRVGSETTGRLPHLLDRISPARRTAALLHFGATEVREMISQGAAKPIFHPIVEIETGSLLAYDVFGRCDLEGAGANTYDLFFVAAYIGLEEELSQLFRAKAAQAACSLANPPLLFLRVHPSEFDAPKRLFKSLETMRADHPSVPLAVSFGENLVRGPSRMRDFVQNLDRLAISMVYENFLGPRERLDEILQFPPDFLKFSRRATSRLVSGDPVEKERFSTLVHAVSDQGIRCVADWVTRAEEVEACREVGFFAAQGPLFGKPAERPAMSI